MEHLRRSRDGAGLRKRIENIAYCVSPGAIACKDALHAAGVIAWRLGMLPGSTTEATGAAAAAEREGKAMPSERVPDSPQSVFRGHL